MTASAVIGGTRQAWAPHRVSLPTPMRAPAEVLVTYVTATEAITWLAFGRAEVLAQVQRVALQDWEASPGSEDAAAERARRNAEYADALERLIAAARDGRVEFYGVPTANRGARHAAIAPSFWLSPVTIRNDATEARADVPMKTWVEERGSGGAHYRDLRCSREQVFKLGDDGQKATAKKLVQDGKGGGDQTDNCPRPSDSAVRQWFRDRVAAWPDDKAAPPENEDRQAAAAHFAPGLTRAEFRLVREDETPVAWRKRGRRAPWGIVKQKLSPP